MPPLRQGLEAHSSKSPQFGPRQGLSQQHIGAERLPVAPGGPHHVRSEFRKKPSLAPFDTVAVHSPHVFSQYVFASLPNLPALVQKPLALTYAQDIL